MRYIKLVNETNRTDYKAPNDLYQLLLYVLQSAKTCSDTVRYNPACLGSFMGCEPFLLPRIYEESPEIIFKYMMLHYYAFGKQPANLAKHRIIDFSPDEIVLPQDLDSLGREIAQFYASQGYIAAYAVHMDDFHLHIHAVVSTVGSYDGRSFHIPYEYNQLLRIVQCWQTNFEDYLDSNPSEYEYRKRALFGDILKYGCIPLTTKGQILQAAR